MDRVKQADYKTSTMTNQERFYTARVQIAAAVALLVWRLADQPPGRYWRDWMIVFALVWGWSAFKPKSPALPVVHATGMAYLLGIYVLGQLPHALAVLGFGV